MEDIPNKVRDVLRIIVDVNLLTEDGKEYIEICVNSNTYPVNSVRPLPMCSGMMRVVAMMESSLHNKTVCIRRPLVSFYSTFLYRIILFHAKSKSPKAIWRFLFPTSPNGIDTVR